MVVLGVDVNDFAGDARKFARKYGLTYPLVHDNHNVTSPKYGLTGLPETFFIDRSGKRRRATCRGRSKAADIQDGVEQALQLVRLARPRARWRSCWPRRRRRASSTRRSPSSRAS